MNDITWALLQPSSVLVALVLLALFASWLRWTGLASTFLTLFLLVVGAVVLLPVGEWLGAPLETRHPQADLPPRVDGIIVLGGAVEWRVTRERGQLSLNDANERVLAGVALAKRYPDAELVMTGTFADAFVNDLRETPTSTSLLFGPEFRNRSITFIGNATSTYEEARRTLEVVAPRAGETWLLVTSAYHMPRALGTFHAQGWRVIPWPVDYRTTGELRLTPNWNVAATLAELDRLVREWGAITIYRQTERMVDVGVGE